MRYWVYLTALSSQIWDFCPADVSSSVTVVELCVGYDDVETQRIVWDQAKHCFLLLNTGQIWTHASKGSKASTHSLSLENTLQNNKSFFKKIQSLLYIISLLHVPTPFQKWKDVLCVNSPKLRKQVPFADWRKYVLMRQYLKNTVSVNSTVKRPGNASSIYREDEKKSWAKWYRISSGVFLSPGVDGSLRFYHKGMKRQEIIYWPAVMEKRHSHLFLVFCWRISSVDNLDWKQIGLFS